MAETPKPSQQDVDQVRAKTTKVVERAKTDAAFKQALQKDPISTLKAEGIPEKAATEFVHSTRKGDVEGYEWVTVYAYECIYYTNAYEYAYETVWE
ncbi:MAG: hypothetical protein M3Y56_08390 [Armatimonadota bacterium]|nr:hypothetical protein [Armatimonadota bacterium]